MRQSRDIFNTLVQADDLEGAVKALSDDELRQVRGALGRGDFLQWPAESVHGMCIWEACQRFENPGLSVPCAECRVIGDHGSEVPQ